MSGFWTGWVIALLSLNLGITVFLFLWGQRVDIPTEPDGTSGHVWAHGVLREAVRRLPLWWVLMSAAVLASGIAYVMLYPALGAYPGLLGWTSQQELTQAQAANAQLQAPLRERMRSMSVE